MKKKLTNILYSFSLLAFLIAFNFQHNPPEGWYQQFLPPINNRPISDITFIDSLTGFAVTPYTANDTAYILKTVDGGDTWNIIFQGPTNVIGGFSKVQFLNLNTGYACRNFLWKTTDEGLNWNQQNTSGIFPENMFVLNEDTIWIIDSEGFTGGIFRTTNGGQNWTQQAALGGNNPTHIYMYNKDTGYAAAGVLYKTTNSGVNWFQIPGGGFGDMHFINATTGWKCYGPMQKTTDGGLNWENVPLPPKSDTLPFSRIYSFHNVDPDTIWGVGSVGIIGGLGRGLIYKTTDRGQSWGYQLPDPVSINIVQYHHIKFVSLLTGWAYSSGPGVHTVTGGDTTIPIMNISQIGSEVPIDFKLHQNYPNPFNPETKINYELRITSYVKLKVFDVTGRIIRSLVDERQNAGTYQYSFDARLHGQESGLASGVYFYILQVENEYADEVFRDVKKMLFIK